MSYSAIYVATVAALGMACVSVDVSAARVAAGGEPQRHHRAPLRHRLVGGPIWYNPDYSTGSYSPSYSTGEYNPGFSIKYHYP